MPFFVILMKMIFMKVLFSLVLLTLVSTRCFPGQEQEVERLRYEAYTRGSSFEIEIDSDSIKVREGLRGTPLRSKPMEPGQWQSLLDTLKEIGISRLGSLEAPSSARYSDAAAHAMVKVDAAGKQYTSVEFDHGQPPNALAPLVKAMITLAETVE